MHESLLAEATLPSPTVVLGIVLKPYSLGHELFLIRENNPLLSPERAASATRAHLAQAILICSQSFEECRHTPFEFRPWYGFKLWIWLRRVRRLRTLTETLKFLAYRARGMREFPLTEVVDTSTRTTPRQPGTPFLLRLHEFLVDFKRMTDAQAWDFPYGLATMKYCEHWESEGGLSVYNEHDAQHDKLVEEFDKTEAEELKKARN